MKRKCITTFILLCMICVILTLTACSHREKYQPALYTKENLLSLYQENIELFEDVVEIIISNKAFYEEGRINEYTDADITSPYDKALTHFGDTERKVIDELFEFKPYMILYDYARRFVKITFISSDNKLSYTFVFWTLDSEDSQYKLDNYKRQLAQHYILEDIQDNRFLFYNHDVGT